jgi:hypothetical protein
VSTLEPAAQALSGKSRFEMRTTPDTELFQYWLAHMDDALDAFVASAPEPIRRQLDDSQTSLDALEAWLLSRYASIAEAKEPSEAQFIDGAARYVGEIFRVRTGSRRMLENRDPKFVFFGRPVLHGGAVGRMTECPLSLVTASLDRRTGRYLSTILANFST